jgi:hypothetical protein
MATFLTEVPEELVERSRKRTPIMKPRDLLQDGQKVLFNYKKNDYVATYETTRGGLVYGDQVFTGFHDFIATLIIQSGQYRPYIEDGINRLPKQISGDPWVRLRVCVGTEWVRLDSLRELNKKLNINREIEKVEESEI